MTDARRSPRRRLAREQRERIADWLVIGGSLVLLISLFLTWSHQFSAAHFGSSSQLQGIAPDPTAWQVYSSMDVVLAVLAVALVGVALAGGRRARLCALAAAGVAIAFVVHALGTPPTNGADIFDPSLGRLGAATAGAGETVALVGLGLAVAGLVAGLTAD